MLTADRDGGLAPRLSFPPGLCGPCRHSRRNETRASSVFRLCERAASDPTYPRNPALPVLSRRGFEQVQVRS